jgi:hypothetical protein
MEEAAPPHSLVWKGIPARAGSPWLSSWDHGPWGALAYPVGPGEKDRPGRPAGRDHGASADAKLTGREGDLSFIHNV